MNPQHLNILILFIVMLIIIVGVFVYVYRTSLPRNTEGSGQSGLSNPNQKRFLFFVILAAVLVILLTATLPKTPYYYFANEEPAKVVFVVARQFSFAMSYQSGKPGTPPPNEAIELPAGKTVEFRVTSNDVNHGFAIYDTQNQLIVQTQAMPGYVNRLRWKFEQPGHYSIRCLEFCGAAHAFMESSFLVK